ncbi:MAG: DnaJ domain-containing protein [Pseudomonadota bacterium]
MPYLVLGLGALALAVVGMNVFVRANPAVLAKVLKRAGGLIALGLALVLLVTGRIALAIPVAVGGFALLTGQGLSSSFGGRRTNPSRGQGSRVRAAYVEMELDHDTGDMAGRVMAGTYEGRELEALSLAELKSVLMEAAGDVDSVRLIEAYLDRRMPGWREDVEGDADAGRGEAGGAGGLGALTLEEAYEILGLQPGATAQEIGKAHKAMMKRVHPDFGGSASLAARVNAAKDLALRHAGE